MSISLMRKLSFLWVLLCLTVPFAQVRAAAPEPAPAATHPTAANDSDQPSDFDDDANSDWRGRRHLRFNRYGSDRVTIGRDSFLGPNEHTNSVVAVLGSAISQGDARQVVAVAGNARVTGPVHDSAVAVLGSVYVDSPVDQDVVAVFGNVELGPHADVGGDVVAVFGTVTRDPAALIHGDVDNVFDLDVSGVHGISGVGWLDIWIKKCLLYGRPLAVSSGLEWAWTLALIMLAFYAVLALMFRSSVDDCVHTLETQPGRTALAALLGMLLTPVLLVLLCITVIGIAAVPFVVMALFCMSLFGKAVVLAWLGGRIIGRRPGPTGHPALAVLIGGAVALALYVIPVIGFMVFKLLGFFGFGAVLYTMILGVRARRAAQGAPLAAAPAPSATAPGATAPGATAPGATAAAVAGAAAPGASAPDAATDAADGGAAAASAAAASAAVPSPAAQIAADLPRAGFWIRMGALLIDVILVGFAMSLLRPFGDFHIVILAIYGAVMWKLRGTTVGGIVFDLQVVRLDGRPLDWETAIVRALGCFLSLAVVGLGFIWIALDSNHQAWHDKIAGTVVVRSKRHGSPLV
jgi:uncharacterized RDD family membrane protein YckC